MARLAEPKDRVGVPTGDDRRKAVRSERSVQAIALANSAVLGATAACRS